MLIRPNFLKFKNKSLNFDTLKFIICAELKNICSDLEHFLDNAFLSKGILHNLIYLLFKFNGIFFKILP